MRVCHAVLHSNLFEIFIFFCFVGKNSVRSIELNFKPNRIPNTYKVRVRFTVTLNRIYSTKFGPIRFEIRSKFVSSTVLHVIIHEIKNMRFGFKPEIHIYKRVYGFHSYFTCVLFCLIFFFKF